jgi:hypothetical protein
MSNLAFATRPERSPRTESAGQHPRHIEIVSTRDQRRKRPKVVYALATVGGLFALFIAQLLLSIVLADGAYEISSLRVEQRDLGRTELALNEQLDLLKSPQNLASRAEGLGMVMSNSTPMFLRLSDGKVLGSSGAAVGSKLVGSNGDLVPNALLSGLPETSETTDAETGTSGSTETGNTREPGTTSTAQTVTSTPGTLASPNTR